MSWNIRYCGVEGARRRVDFLSSRNWDVVALQEVSRRAWDVITESGIAESSAYSLNAFEATPPAKRHHGAALLARNGFRLSQSKLVLGIPKAERALVARTTVGGTPVTVASWHAPNAAGEGVDTKMRAYRGISDWLGTAGGPIVLGLDGNHWNRSVDLEPKNVPDTADPWLLENRFFGVNKPHRTRDAFLDHLRGTRESTKRSRSEGRTDRWLSLTSAAARRTLSKTASTISSSPKRSRSQTPHTTTREPQRPAATTGS